MKKIFTVAFLVLTMCGFVFAQSKLPELDKARKIKLLESTREDVKEILANYEEDGEDSEDFFSEHIGIEITYTDGDCNDDSSEETWNVPEGKVKFIQINLYEGSEKLTVEDLGFNISNFQKEQEFSNVEDRYIYHNKSFGIAFRVNENGVKRIFLFPSKSYQSLLCNKKPAKEFYSKKSWFSNSKLKDRIRIIEYYPRVTDLTLSATKIILGCDISSEDYKKECSDTNKEIRVTAVEKNIANDVISYYYNVSAGKIVGKGKEVLWDLSGVKLGNYTIEAEVSNGGGMRGAQITKSIVIQECSDCSVKDN